MKNHLIALAAGLVLTVPSVRADEPVVPTANFPATRYEALWTKSPFAVETAEAVTNMSPDYMLVGIANVEGISYASVVERQSQEHFLISTDKPTRGLTLTSITRGHDGQDTYATVQKDGQPITLKLEQPPAMVGGPGAPGMPPINQVPMPNVMTPQITMPGAGTGPGAPFLGGASQRPFTRIHRPAIHLPPPPGQLPPPQPQQPIPPPQPPK